MQCIFTYATGIHPQLTKISF